MTRFAGLLVPTLMVLAAAGPLSAAGLKEIYELAADRDVQLRSAESEYRAAAEARPQARAPLLPQIEATASHSRSDTDVKGDKDYAYDTDSMAVTLSQTLFNARQFSALGVADSRVAAAEARRDAARQELIVRVARTYFDVIAAEEVLEFARAEKEAVGRQLEQTEKRFEVGLVAITDVLEARARHDLALAQEIAAENQLDLAREALAVVIGEMPPRVLRKLAADPPLSAPDPVDPDYWAQTALERNLTLRAATHAAEAASQNVKVQRSGHLPTLSLSANVSSTDVGNAPSGSRETDDRQLLVQLRVPIFSGGLTSSLAREAWENAAAAREDLEFVRRDVVRSTRGAYLSVLSGASRVRALEQALASTRAAAEAAEVGYEVGTRTIVDVLLALREVYRASSDLAQTRYDLVVEQLRLRQAAGTLGEDDIMMVDGWLQP